MEHAKDIFVATIQYSCHPVGLAVTLECWYTYTWYDIILLVLELESHRVEILNLFAKIKKINSYC